MAILATSSSYEPTMSIGKNLITTPSGVKYAAVSKDNKIKVYKSIDGGVNWTDIGPTLTGEMPSIAFKASNNSIHLIFQATVNGFIAVKYVNYNETTANAWSTSYTIMSSSAYDHQTPVIAVDSVGSVHVSWLGQNSTYGSTFKLFYKKRTGTAWGTSEVINTSSTDLYFLDSLGSILIDSNNIPHIIGSFIDNDGSFDKVGHFWKDGTWQYDRVNQPNGTNNTEPDAIIDKDGNICVVWRAKDNASDAKTKIKFSKRVNGVWAQWLNIGIVNGYNTYTPKIGCNDYGDYYVLFNANDNYKIKGIKYHSFWSDVKEITGNTGEDYYNIEAKMVNDQISIIFTSYATPEYSNIVINNIPLNQVPLTPSNLVRSNYDATQQADITYKFNDMDIWESQSANQLQVLENGVVIYDTLKVTASVWKVVIPANTLQNGKQYQAKIKCWDNADTESPWSDLILFRTSARPIVTITSISNNDVVIGTNLTAAWNCVSSSGAAQGTVQIKLTTEADVVLWDSGKLTDSALRSKAVGYKLYNQTSYKLKLSIVDEFGVQADEVVVSFSTMFTTPIKPILTALSDNYRGAVKLVISNPDPGPSDPHVTENEIYRRAKGETQWERLVESLAENGAYIDYTLPYMAEYEYYVRTYGDNDTFIESSTISITAAFYDTQLALTTDYSKWVELKYNPQKQEKYMRKKTFMEFSGRKDPVSEVEVACENTQNVSFKVLDKEILLMLKYLEDSGEILLYRDNRGIKMYCMIDGGITLQNEKPNGWVVSFLLRKVSYKEVI